MVDLIKLKEIFDIERQTEKYQAAFTKENPLVSVIVCTFNRSRILVDYCLSTILNQTYKNLEIIVCGDRCTDDTEERMKKVIENDSRVTFFNLIDRPEYSKIPGEKWLMVGTYNYNKGLQLSTGDFIAHCDDDDCFKLDKIEKLVKFAQQEKAELIHHPFSYSHGLPVNNSDCIRCGLITTSALFYHSFFKNIEANPDCYKLGLPGDFYRCNEMVKLGATVKRFPEILTNLKVPVGF